MSREMEIGLLIGQATKIFEDALKVAFDVNTKTAARTYNEITQVMTNFEDVASTGDTVTVGQMREILSVLHNIRWLTEDKDD
mgnify:CR=1 FL=1